MNPCNKILSEACALGDWERIYHCVTQRFANIDNVDHCGITPLAWAAKFNKIDVMEYLLSLGAIVDHRSSVTSRTPLQVACAYGNRNIQAVALLLKHGASLDLNCESDLKDMRGTALNQAIICHYESKRLVKMLKAHIQYHKEKEMRGKNNIDDEYFYDRNNVMRSP